MLLAIDVGNTNLKIGIFDKSKLKASWRLSTTASRTSDEYGMVLYDLLSQENLSFTDIDDTVISSVAPMLNYTLEHMCQYYIQKKPLMVSSDINVGIKIKYKNLSMLGSDRIIGALATYKEYGGPAIVIDFGSATTFDLVTGDGVFLGGAIAPGIKTSAESLVNTAVKLPRVELIRPANIVGQSTVACMQSGIVYGYAGMVKYMIDKYKEVDGMKNAKVVATGGLSELIHSVEPELIDVIDRALSLKGLRYIYEINK